jgi:hypothetical protein
MALDGQMSDSQCRHVRLLEWLAGFEDSVPSVAEFYEEDETRFTEARQDILALDGHGFVNQHMSIGGLGALAAMVQPRGREYLDDIASYRGDKGRRQWACRSAMVSWLYDCDATVESGRSIPWGSFIESANFFGDDFNAEEVDRGSGWLKRHGLIDGIEAAQAIGPIRAMLTAEGVRCVERFDSDVRAYLDAMEQPVAQGDTWNVTGNVQIATGDRSQQTMNINPPVNEMVLAMQGGSRLTEAV